MFFTFYKIKESSQKNQQHFVILLENAPLECLRVSL